MCANGSEADYNLNSVTFKSSASVIGIVREAPVIVDAIQRWQADPALAEMRAKIRAYARDVLRIVVDEA